MICLTTASTPVGIYGSASRVPEGRGDAQEAAYASVLRVDKRTLVLAVGVHQVELHRSVAVRAKHDTAAIRRPARKKVLFVIIGQGVHADAVNINHVDLQITVVISGEQDFRSIGGERGVGRSRFSCRLGGGDAWQTPAQHQRRAKQDQSDPKNSRGHQRSTEHYTFDRRYSRLSGVIEWFAENFGIR